MKKVTRREARELVVQFLFQLDMNPPEDIGAAFGHFWETNDPGGDARAFVERLVLGVREHMARLDSIISKYAENWEIGRMGIVERNAMRMAIYEMLHCPDVPHVVAINEAVDITKYFSTNPSGRFVNAILDRVRKEMRDDASNRPVSSNDGAGGGNAEHAGESE